MQRIILFEGHDNGGKTNIARALSINLMIPYFKDPGTKDYFFDRNVLDTFKASAMLEYELLKQTKYSLIRDRSFVSEYCYSKAFKRESPFEFIEQLDELYSKLNTTIILCHKKTIDSLNFFDECISYKDVEILKKEFFAYMEWTKCKKLILDTTDENLKNQLTKIRGTVL